MLPEGWNSRAIRDCAEIITGYAFTSENYIGNSDQSIRLLRGDNVVPEGIRWEDAKFWAASESQKLRRYEMQSGDIVVALDRPIISSGLKLAVLQEMDLPSLLVQRVARLRAKEGCDQRFIGQALQSQRFILHLKGQKTETAVPHISLNDIRDYEMAVPPIAEQRRISELLASWSSAIATSERLLANSRKQKRALIRCVLRNSKGWRAVRLDSVATRIQRQSDGGSHAILMISAAAGFVLQQDMYSRFMAGKSLDSYVLLQRGEFAYNKGNSKSYEFGCIYLLEDFEQGMVPHVYVCFSMDERVCHRPFYKYLFEADYLHDQLGALVNTGVRNNGLLNIRPADFMATRIPLPPIEVQREIANILAEASQMIRHEEQALHNLRIQKRALMQQLLTGRRRLRVSMSAQGVSA